jgi:hypothetical protein
MGPLLPAVSHFGGKALQSVGNKMNPMGSMGDLFAEDELIDALMRQDVY